MIGSQRLVMAIRHVTDVQSRIEEINPLWWELEHARSCLLQAHQMIERINANEGQNSQVAADGSLRAHEAKYLDASSGLSIRQAAREIGKNANGRNVK